MSRKRRKQRPTPKPKPASRDYRSFFGGCVLALVVLSAVSERLWPVLRYTWVHNASHAQLVEVPEIVDEEPVPPAEVEVPPTPEEPAVVEQPAAAPEQPADLLREVQIEGPVDAIVGDPVHLRVRTQGGAINYAWTIHPDVDGLFVLDDGSSAIFTNRNAQTYTVYVSATDRFGSIEQDTMTFELVDKKTNLTPQSLREANPEPTVEESIDYFVTLVRSTGKEREVIVIAQSFRQIANLLRNGAMNPGEDVLANAEAGLEITLTPQVFAAWENFFVPLRGYLQEYKNKGYLDTRDAYANTLDNLASILESRRQRIKRLQ